MKEERRRQKQLEANFEEEYFEDHGGRRAKQAHINVWLFPCLCIFLKYLFPLWACLWLRTLEITWFSFCELGCVFFFVFFFQLWICEDVLLMLHCSGDCCWLEAKILECIHKHIIRLEERLTCSYRKKNLSSRSHWRANITANGCSSS